MHSACVAWPRRPARSSRRGASGWVTLLWLCALCASGSLLATPPSWLSDLAQADPGPLGPVDAANCPATWRAPQPGDAEAAVEIAFQYFPQWRSALAWRRFGADCVLLDWPEQRRLDAAEARGLAVHAAKLHATHRELPAAIAVEALPARIDAHTPRPIPPGHRARMLADDATRPCPRTPAPAQRRSLRLPAAWHASMVRIGPQVCPDELSGAGSGVLLTPDLVLTAAHVVLSASGQRCSVYRLVPGARSYRDDPPAPEGVLWATLVRESGRGGWRQGQPQLSADDAPGDERPRHDYAFLRSTAAVDARPRVWPMLRFERAAPAVGSTVYKAGYARRGVYGERRTGALVATTGQTACARGAEQARRFALAVDDGDSGAPIFLPATDTEPLEVLSLAVLSEWRRDESDIEVIGPRFDLGTYQDLLAILALEVQPYRSELPPMRRVEERRRR